RDAGLAASLARSRIMFVSTSICPETVLTPQAIAPGLRRRQLLKSLAASAGCALFPARSFGYADTQWHPRPGDEAFLDDLERQACLFFWEQASDKTGQVLDRARNDLGGSRDPRRMASI